MRPLHKKAVCIALQLALLFAVFRARSVAAVVCIKSPGIIFTWDESSNPLGPSRCSNDCECSGTRTCSSSGFCESAPPLPPRPPRPPPPQPPPPVPPAPPPPVITVLLSRYFCGSTWSSSATSPSQAVPSNNPYRNISGFNYESDVAVAVAGGSPLLSISIRASIISIYEAWSTYRDLGKGPLHSAWNNSDPVYTLNLSSAWNPYSPDKIEAVSACCYKSSTAGRPVTPYRLLFRTQSGVVRRLGKASTDPRLCDTGDVSQPWDYVEPGYLLAGLVTEVDRDWGIAFSRIAFVFMRIPGFSDVAVPKLPLPPLPPADSYGSLSTAWSPSGSSAIGATGGSSSSSRSGSSSSASGGNSSSSTIGIVVGVVVGAAALLAGAIFGFVLLKKRARRRYGSDVAFDGASCSFYPTHGGSSAGVPAAPPPPPAAPYGYQPYQQYPSSFAAGGAAPYYPPPPTSPAAAGLGRSASGPAPAPHFMPSLQRQGTLSNSIALQLQVLFGENAVINIRPGAAAPPTVTIEEVPASPPSQPQTFGAEELAAATSGFAPSQLLARLPTPVRGMTCAGGSVYAGRLLSEGAAAGGGDGGRQIAVWQVDDAPSAAVVAPSAEAAAPAVQLAAGVVRRLAALRHPHLLPLLGDCPEKVLLVYELAQSSNPAAAGPGATGPVAPFATLSDRLLAQPPPDAGTATAVNGAAASMPPSLPVLGWRDRVRIGYEVAAAVAFLHSQRPPLFCRVPLDAARVVVATASGSARLGFVALGGGGSGGVGGGYTPDMRAEAAAEDVRALGVLLLRLLTGDATGGAAALEARVHSARQADTAGGGGGRALTSLVFDGAGGERWPAAEALAFANAALRCCSASATSSGGSIGGGGGPDSAADSAAPAAGGGPDLNEVVLPYLLQLSNRTRLYAPGQQQPHAAAPAGSAAAGAHPAGANGGTTAAAGDGGNVTEPASLPDDIPPLFLCPITQDLMQDPVVAADGFSYERLAIEQWIASSAAAGRAPRSPMTNLAFEHKSLVPNRVLKSQIAAWREEQAAAATQLAAQESEAKEV
ncbi:hypothetical protein HYH02_005656 [Chlamydomonas schloesseri]|uniref:U-box domain-containing protein n=1 Tax=Chlamydomonas schloesseri TaxID=2026947 RepID=A0A836B715_9CHLO|nr:hypothetical protein HYH02_005656 [Chlamydomonas schloesseri]|eukprot:KAG2449512.1 hypothetical protein HYH02_005656 [Chlamydomonas schloesseri]